MIKKLSITIVALIVILGLGSTQATALPVESFEIHKSITTERVKVMGCICATRTDEYHGWECSITEGPCMYLYPNSRACAEDYGEGPDAVEEVSS